MKNFETIERSARMRTSLSSRITKGTATPIIWNRIYHFFAYKREEFLAGYHKRSNVETTFSMIKRTCDDFVRARNYSGQVNELLLKCQAHDIVWVFHEAARSRHIGHRR